MYQYCAPSEGLAKLICPPSEVPSILVRRGLLREGVVPKLVNAEEVEVEVSRVALDGIVVLLIVTPAILLIVLPNACEVEPNVIEEFDNLALVIEPASIVLVTVPVSEVFTNPVASKPIVAEVEVPLLVIGEVTAITPDAPVAPVAPVGPVTVDAAPAAPVAPVGPVGPVTVEAAPTAPVGPVGPVGPVTVDAAPIGPVGPVTVEAAPVGPVGPVAPSAPLIPLVPFVPEGPVGPVLPITP
jgi:hypothetical protein